MVLKTNRSKLPNKRLQRLWERYRKGDCLEARNALIAYYRRYAYAVVRRVRARLPRTVETGDLRGAGDIGLIQAIQNFDPERGVPFEAFCERRVRGAILDELRRHDWLPRPVRQRLNLRRELREDLRTRLGHDPSDAEIASAMQISLQEYLSQYQPGRDTPVLAGARPAGTGQNGESGLDYLEDPRELSPAEDAFRREMLETISQTLEEQDRLVLYLRFFEGRTLREIGEELGLSPSRVSKIVSGAVARLKERFTAQTEPAD